MPKKQVKLSGRQSGSATQGQAVARANRWRDNYNPLRGLVMSRVAALLEDGERGAFADLQWLYRFIEKRYAILRTVKHRRRAAVRRLDWDIKTVSELPDGATEEQAEAQRQTLRAAYDAIDNLEEAIGFLALAEFRGFAHLQKHRTPDGDVMHLECLHQWNWIRDGSDGDWYYNADAQVVTAVTLGEDKRLGSDALPREDFILREEDDPINEIALINFVRSNLSQKDWDGFVELFGIERPIIVGPPNVPKELETEYRDSASSVAEGGGGYLPNGSDVKYPGQGNRGSNPFKEHKDEQREEVVLAATGGLLTVLSQPTGIGQGASGEHGDAFDQIAADEGYTISQIFQAQFDTEILAREFPEQPVLAYFCIEREDKDDAKSLNESYGIAVRAGAITPNQEDEAWLREKLALPAMSADVLREWKKVGGTRAPITIQQEGGAPNPFQRGGGAAPAPAPSPARGGSGEKSATNQETETEQQLANRDASAAGNSSALASAIATEFAPLNALLAEVLAVPDAEVQRRQLTLLRNHLRTIVSTAAPRAALQKLYEQEFALAKEPATP